MRKFVISDRFTTADIGLDLEADRVEELYTAAAEGMFSIIFGDKPAGEKTTAREINLRASTGEQLLIDWLSELLYLFDAESLIAVEYRLNIDSADNEFSIKGTVDFRKYDWESDVAEHEVKAVTYYKLKIERESGLYRCHVVFDL